MIRTLSFTLALIPTILLADSLPATHSYSGLATTAAPSLLKRDGRRPFAPRFEAASMPLPSAVRPIPGQRKVAESPLIRVVLPTYRLIPKDLGIEDTQEVIFFGEKRFVRLNLKLEASGKALSQRWMEHLRTYFDYLDRDGDGELNLYESEYVSTNRGLRNMLESGFSNPMLSDIGMAMEELDLDRNRRISFDEYAAYYAPTAVHLVRSLNNALNQNTYDPITEELFQLIDTNKDGQITQQELIAFEKKFPAIDNDEDECLTVNEIRAFPPPPATAMMAAPGGKPVGPLTTRQEQMLAYPVGKMPDTVVESVFRLYDSDKNLRLSKKESPFSEVIFAQLDLDSSGDLSLVEFARLKSVPADLDVVMVLGEKPEGNDIRLVSPKESPLTKDFQVSGKGTALLSVGQQTILLNCDQATGIYRGANPSQIEVSFPASNYLTEKDVIGPQMQYLRILFDIVDRDADGRMTRAEYDAYNKVQQGFHHLSFTLVYAASVPNLFQLMDMNGDGRLSVREIRNAWSRLIPYEPKEKNAITRSALQPHGGIRWSYTRNVNLSVSQALTQFDRPATRKSGEGPLWFQKFDRNGDGELSRQEFPGATAEFDRLDTNRDGFISSPEAIAADKKFRVSTKETK
jgi:Ca2+-binding EF-hand superfamily protein